MPPHRDVGSFEERATRYEEGWLGRLHHQIADQTAALALAASAEPGRVLDIGCGTGYLLRHLARQYPQAAELAGLDAAPAMIDAATLAADDPRLRFSVGLAGPAGRAAGSCPGARTRRPFGHGRSILSLAHPHADRCPPGQGPHPRHRETLSPTGTHRQQGAVDPDATDVARR